LYANINYLTELQLYRSMIIEVAQKVNQT